MTHSDCIIVGAGLAGLSCGFELAELGWRPVILEAKPYVGWRIASWEQDGMPVESGLHRVLGFYEAFPSILKRAGLDLDAIIVWEDEFTIHLYPDLALAEDYTKQPYLRTMEGAVVSGQRAASVVLGEKPS